MTIDLSPAQVVAALGVLLALLMIFRSERGGAAGRRMLPTGHRGWPR